MPWTNLTVSTVTMREMGTKLLMTIIHRPQLVSVSTSTLRRYFSLLASFWLISKPRYEWLSELLIDHLSAPYPKRRQAKN